MYEVLFGVLGDLIVSKTTKSTMGQDLIGIAVVGYGYWGPNLVRNFPNTNGAQVIAVSDFDAAKTDGRIDAIAIATPVQSHYDLALQALRAGKHVFIEKPLTQTSEQVRHLIDKADRRNLSLLVDHTFLYTPACRRFVNPSPRGLWGTSITTMSLAQLGAVPNGCERDLGPDRARRFDHACGPYPQLEPTMLQARRQTWPTLPSFFRAAALPTSTSTGSRPSRNGRH
jgi:hypothetical protein